MWVAGRTATPLVTDKRSEGTGMLREMLSSISTALCLCSCIKPVSERILIYVKERKLFSFTNFRGFQKKSCPIVYTHTKECIAGTAEIGIRSKKSNYQ